MAEILKDEIMSDEQLDGVAGGTYAESDKDLRFLKDIGALAQDSVRQTDNLTRAFAQHGVSMVVHFDDTNHNEYFNASGKQITREAALKEVLKKSGTKVNPYTGSEIKLADYL